MRLIITLILNLIILSSCSKNSNFTVSGTIKGLKKGTLYLQTVQDTNLISLDSIIVDGNPDFKFTTSLSEPQVLYLYLDKKSALSYGNRIAFFAEPGKMSIMSSLKCFEKNAIIKGSKNQLKWEDFQKMTNQFNDKNLDLIKKSLEVQNSKNQKLTLKYDDSLDQLLQKRYRYTGNFSIINKSYEIAPYIVITQIPDAAINYLDTIYKSFPLKTQNSIYGKQLKELIQNKTL